VITIDPSPPVYSMGTVNLYSLDFLKLSKKSLTKNGLLCLWLPPMPLSELNMLIATFKKAFPYTELWQGKKYKGCYLLGSDNSFNINNQRFNAAFADKKIYRDLTQWDKSIATPKALKDLYLLSNTAIKKYVKGFPIVTDNLPLTEFPLWRKIFNKDYHKAGDTSAFQ
jgi:spermidine synthase